MTSPTSLPVSRPAVGPRPLRLLLVMRRFVESFSQLAYIMTRAGMRVDVLGTEWTRAMSGCQPVENFIEAPYESAEFCRRLSEIAAQQGYDMVMLVDEPALNAVLESLPAHPELAKYLAYAPDSTLGKAIGSKARFYELCQQNGIPIPTSEMADSVEDAQAIALRIGFPSLLKGATGSGGQTVFIIENEAELKAQLGAWQHGFPIIVQQFVRGETVGATMLSYKGQLRGWIGITKMLCLNGGKGPSVVSLYRNNDKIRQACEKFAALGEYTGISGFDFMLTPEGEIYVIDPHFGRITPRSHLGLYCGVDFAALLRDALQGKSTVQNPQPSQIATVKFPEFVEYALTGNFWRLMRAAPPFSKNSRYCITPELGLKFNLHLAKKSAALGLRLRAKKLRGVVSRVRRR